MDRSTTDNKEELHQHEALLAQQKAGDNDQSETPLIKAFKAENNRVLRAYEDIQHKSFRFMPTDLMIFETFLSKKVLCKPMPHNPFYEVDDIFTIDPDT